jgi:multidrug resistance efflux pump
LKIGRLNLDRIKQMGATQVQTARNEAARAEQALIEAQDNLARLLKEPDAQDVEAAKLDVSAAELALTEARSKLEDATIRAPFDGVVARTDVDAGDAVSVGEIALVLATLDQLQARTVDLTELDVARISVGQAVVVTVDALPGEEITARVARIGLQAENYRGDVTYPVLVELDDPPPSLRWGMTAVVTSQTE